VAGMITVMWALACVESITVEGIGYIQFLPRCMQCRRGLAMRILSVRPSVCQTRDLWQKCKKDRSRFLYHTKDHL